MRTVRPSSPDVADALFTELELAEEELRVIREQMAEQDRRIFQGSDAADRERTVLRAVFGEIPVPVFVLDEDGLIRRANGAAAELLGTSSGYVTGKPFPVFIDLTARAAFRSQLSAVLRNGGKSSFNSVILVSRQHLRARIMLARIHPPSEVRPLLAAAVLPPVAQPGIPGCPALPGCPAGPGTEKPVR